MNSPELDREYADKVATILEGGREGRDGGPAAFFPPGSAPAIRHLIERDEDRQRERDAMRTRTVSVTWDTEGESLELPGIVAVPAELDDEAVADWLSDEYGWCVHGWAETTR